MRDAHSSYTRLRAMFLCAALPLWVLAGIPAVSSASEPGIPVLLYHRFGRQVSDSMTVKTGTFESQLHELAERGYKVIPLRQLADHLAAQGAPLPARSVAITVDDGHRSVYTELLPVVLRNRIPVTLFIYPSAISNARYALTWQQLRELKATGLFDIQSHTYWHPNFAREKRRLLPSAYKLFVDTQLINSRKALEGHLGGKVNLLAWPFGIHDSELEERARKAGYIAAFTLERRAARSGDNPMAIPRFLITDAMRGKAFIAALEQHKPAANEVRND